MFPHLEAPSLPTDSDHTHEWFETGLVDRSLVLNGQTAGYQLSCSCGDFKVDWRDATEEDRAYVSKQ